MSNILKLNSEREKKLKLLKENPKENGKEINSLLLTIRNDYRNLIVEQPTLSSSIKKDIDGLLWKQCYYKQIEEYRRGIKKTSGLVDQEKTRALAEQHLLKLTAAFLKFLNDAVSNYQDLLQRLESKYRATKSLPPLTSSSQHEINCLLQSIHRCLLYLGDLTRYRVLHADHIDKDYSESERYYERAAFIIPQSGNPHNQLAVLSTYNEIECMAMYHYCRSLLCEQPFAGGIENLALLVEKNARIFEQLNDNVKQLFFLSLNSAANPHERRKKEVDVKMKIFFVNFVRLHGILFTWTKKMKECVTSYFDSKDASPNSGETDESHKTPSAAVLDTNAWDILLRETLTDFDDLLAANAFGDFLLIRLIVICAFSVHNSAFYEILGDKRKELCVSQFAPYRSLGESLAISAMFGMVNKIAAVICRVTNAPERNRKSGISRLLAGLSIFAEWASVNTQYLQATIPQRLSESRQLDEEIAKSTLLQAVVAHADAIRTESRSRSSIRSVLTILQEYLEASISKFESSSHFTPQLLAAASLMPLREHIELRGFIPLKEHIETFFASIDPLVNYPPEHLTEELARDRRQRIIRSFVRDWLIPTADREAKESEQQRSRKMPGAEVAGRGATPQSSRRGILEIGNNETMQRLRDGKTEQRSEQREPRRKRGGRRRERRRGGNHDPAFEGRNEYTDKFNHPGARGINDTDVGGNNTAASKVEDEFPPLPGHTLVKAGTSIDIRNSKNLSYLHIAKNKIEGFTNDEQHLPGEDDEDSEGDFEDEDESGSESNENVSETCNKDDDDRVEALKKSYIDDSDDSIVDYVNRSSPHLRDEGRDYNFEEFNQFNEKDEIVEANGSFHDDIRALLSNPAPLDIIFSANKNGFPEDMYDDEDLDDEIIVFRPAFSRATSSSAISLEVSSNAANEKVTSVSSSTSFVGLFGGDRIPNADGDLANTSWNNWDENPLLVPSAAMSTPTYLSPSEIKLPDSFQSERTALTGGSSGGLWFSNNERVALDASRFKFTTNSESVVLGEVKEPFMSRPGEYMSTLLSNSSLNATSSLPTNKSEGQSSSVSYFPPGLNPATLLPPPGLSRPSGPPPGLYPPNTSGGDNRNWTANPFFRQYGNI